METQDWFDPYDRYMELCFLAMDKISSEGYQALNEVERLALHTYLLDTEVSNGGFDQYFSNYAGDYALDTVESLHLIGATRILALLTQAINEFGAVPPSTNRMSRCKQMEALPEAAVEKWSALDREFFEINNLIDHTIIYLEENHLYDDGRIL